MFFKSFQGRVSICRSYPAYLLRLIIEIMYSYYLGIIALFVFWVLSENGAQKGVVKVPVLSHFWPSYGFKPAILKEYS